MYSDPNGDGDPADGVLLLTTTTDATGAYQFANVGGGDYVVVELDPLGAGSTNDLDGSGSNSLNQIGVALPTGGTSNGNDFLDDNVGTASISGQVLADTDNDDVGDVGVPGVTVELLDGTGNPIDSDLSTPGVQPTTVVTDGSGNYSFMNLPAGDYRVAETDLAGYVSLSDIDGGDPNVIGDPTPITLLAGGSSSGNDFVDEQLASISGQVRYDLDGDGNLGDTEPGISGVTIELRDSGFAVIATTVTDTNGNYSFTGLEPGDYYTQEADPFGYTSTADADGGFANRVAVIGLAAGVDSINNDFLDIHLVGCNDTDEYAALVLTGAQGPTVFGTARAPGRRNGGR